MGRGFVLAGRGNRSISPGVGVCLAAALLVVPLSTDAAGAPGRRPHDVFGGISSSQIVVRLKENAYRNPVMSHRLATLGRDADPREALGDRLRNEARSWRVTGMRPAFSTEFAHPDRAAKLGLDRTYIIEVPPGSDTETMAEAFAQLNEDVELATVDTVGGVAGADAQLIPNDPSFGIQYAMNNTGQFILGSNGVSDADIDAPEAWALHTGDFGTVTIAILDSGLLSHPDLGTNAAPYPNGRIVQGRNTNNPLTPTLTIDECNPRHGTHVSGIAAATGNNGVGVAGPTWGAYVMPVRVVNSICNGTISQLSDGIRWAADNGADIINMSLQYPLITSPEIPILQAAVDYARAAGVLLVAAGGNGRNCDIAFGTPGVCYPARAANTVGVTATNNRDQLCTAATCGWSSNFGNEVDVSAPGDDIYSFAAGGGYTYLSGTSMAAPHVSGVAALVKSYRIELTNVDLESILTVSADDKGTPGWDQEYGFGRINAHRALLTAETWRGIVIGSDPPSGAIDARKPTDRDGTNVHGWQFLDVTMSVYASLQTDGDFVLGLEGGVAGPPAIASVSDLGGERVRVSLQQPIERSAWTTIEHLPSGVEVRLGFLPGDVNANRLFDGNDITALRLALGAFTVTRGQWSMDIDRSGLATGSDLLELVDLYNGAEGYDQFAGRTLP